MKTILTLLLMITLFSCKKESDDSQQPGGELLGALNTTWTVSSFGGVNNNNLKFKISENGGVGTGIITELGASKFGFAVGDEIYKNIGSTGTGTYVAQGKYTYGTNNASSSYRNSILVLQNNNSQLKVTQPALNASFPEIIYIYLKQ